MASRSRKVYSVAEVGDFLVEADSDVELSDDEPESEEQSSDDGEYDAIESQNEESSESDDNVDEDVEPQVGDSGGVMISKNGQEILHRNPVQERCGRKPEKT